MDQNKNEVVRIRLTDEQKSKIQEQTGKQAESLDLSVQELEERIAPRAVIDAQ
jgi:uncharacterized small protein (DUF1192 family)